MRKEGKEGGREERRGEGEMYVPSLFLYIHFWKEEEMGRFVLLSSLVFPLNSPFYRSLGWLLT